MVSVPAGSRIQGLSNSSPQSAQRNVSVVIIKVLDRAYLQASVLHEFRCYQVHMGPIIYQTGCLHTIYYCCAQI